MGTAPENQPLLRHGGIALTPGGLRVIGPQSRPYAELSGNDHSLIRALRPMDWHRWLRIDAASYADRAGPLPGHLAVTAQEVVRFATASPSKLQAAALIEAWLEESSNRATYSPDHRLQGLSLIDTIEQAIINPDVQTAQVLCRITGLNHPALARICKLTFGFTPKLLLCRERFLRSFAAIIPLPRGSWAEAIDPAYVDQSHFIRDSHRFLGMCPSDFLALTAPMKGAAFRVICSGRSQTAVAA